MLGLGSACVENVGPNKNKKKTRVEATLKYHPVRAGTLTSTRDPGQEQRQAGSLTGAVAS